jgi:hypothetical protein
MEFYDLFELLFAGTNDKLICDKGGKDKFSISLTTPLVNEQVPHRRLASRTVLICDGTVPKISGFGIDFFQPSGQVGTDFLH